MGQAARTRPTDPDAFIAWENRQRGRYELIGGLVRPRTGGTVAYSLVATNIMCGLRGLATGCVVHGSMVKVRCPSGSVVYPDGFVRRGPADPMATVIGDPVLVVEVESPGTKRYDMTVKRWAYQSIASLAHLLFVVPDRCLVELVTRQDGDRWLSTFYRSLDAVVPLEALGIELPLAEVYAGVAV